MTAVLAGAPVFTSTTKTLYVIARDVEYLGTAMLWGGLAFVSVLWPAGASVAAARRLLGGAWLAGALGTVFALGLEGAWAAQLGPSSAFRSDVLRHILELPFGREWFAKLMLWILALVVLADVWRRGSAAVTTLPWRVGAVAVGLGMIRISGLTGHVQDTPRPTIAELADVAHLLAISLWLGGLAVLVVGVLPRRDPVELEQVVPRYSSLAMACTTVIVASGTVLAWRMLGGLGELTSTTWGHLLLLKVGLLAGVLAVAYASKTWVAHRLDFAVILRGEAAVVRPFVASVAAETAIVIAVVCIAGFLTTADVGR